MRGTIQANGNEISLITGGTSGDYISLTDIARYKSDAPKDVIKNWMRSKETILFLGLWEKLHNPAFKGVEFDSFKNEAGTNAFVLSPQKWISTTNAIGIVSKSGRYGGGTFAHTDIAFEFASWVSAEFKLYIIQDYQRIKAEETSRQALEWNVSRIISKINYRIHTDAIKEILFPPDITPAQQSRTFASEADLLNVALFGMTAREWETANPDAQGNIRDNASLHQLIVLSNMESINAEYIRLGLSSTERLLKLNNSAKQMMRSLLDSPTIKQLEKANPSRLK